MKGGEEEIYLGMCYAFALLCLLFLGYRTRRFGVSLSKTIQWVKRTTTSTWHKKLFICLSYLLWVVGAVLSTDHQRPRVAGSVWYGTTFFFCPWYPSKLRWTKDINNVSLCVVDKLYSSNYTDRTKKELSSGLLGHNYIIPIVLLAIVVCLCCKMAMMRCHFWECNVKTIHVRFSICLNSESFFIKLSALCL